MMALSHLLVLAVIAETTRAHAMALADTMAGALLSTVWEGAVLVAAVALALRLVPGISAALRTRLWLAVLAVLVVLPALHILLPDGVAKLVSQQAHALRPLQVSAAWSVWLACAWAVLSLTRAVQLVAGAVRLRRIARSAVPVAPMAASAALRLGDRDVELCLSDEVGRPSVVGFLRPRILLPPALFAALTPEELRHVVLHEMEHLRRHDDWTNLLQKLALVVLPLHPALFWVERRLCAERELACDDGVLRAGSVLRTAAARKAYAACLVSLAEHAMVRRGVALALGAWERQSELVRRVHRILRRPEPALRPGMARVVAGGLLGGVLAGGALLAGSPQLVSFAPEAGIAMASAGSGAGDRVWTGQGDALHVPATMQPVTARVPGSGLHVTLANAVLPTRGITVAKAHNSRSHARIAMQRASLHAVAAVRGVQTFRQVSYRAAQAEPRLVQLTAWPDTVPVLTLSLGTDDEFSPSYAAVPVRGGWLLVQL